MENEVVTVSRILREGRHCWPGGLERRKYSVLNLIAQCRTGVLGQTWSCCEGCGHGELHPQSCGNRHCPGCHASRGAQWASRVMERLPDVGHFHVVFTLPAAACSLMAEEGNFRPVGDILFASVDETLRTFMANNNGCVGGWLTVMHTWGGTLSWHPHIHTIVSAGGERLGDGSWVGFRDDYLFPVRALSKVFRAVFLRRLRESPLVGWQGELACPSVRREWLRSLAARDWVVYAKPTLGKTRSLVRYLARYAYRSAIADSRLEGFDASAGTVRFRYRDRRGGAAKRPTNPGGADRLMELSVREFVRRFASHIAPRGFRRIRYYGHLARGKPPRDRPGHPAGTPGSRACPSCGGVRWTRKRLPASLFMDQGAPAATVDAPDPTKQKGRRRLSLSSTRASARSPTSG